MPKPVRIALVMGGGVSLGSFSGGALAELVRLLRDFPAERDGVPLRAELDVLTGASAGPRRPRPAPPARRWGSS